MPDLDRRSTWRSIDFLYLAFILLIAGALRLLNLDYAEFKGDEADNLFAALPIITQGRLPLAGIESSIGTFNPPLFSYLLAIPLFFSRDPVVATAFVGAVNCLSVAGLYALCRRFFNVWTARIAALLFAINPWAVFYSRKIWQQDLLPLFVVGFFFCVLMLAVEKRGPALSCAFVFLAAATQLHLSSVYLLVVLVIVLITQRPGVGWRYYGAGLAILCLSYAPYLVFDLFHHGYNARAYLDVWHRPSRLHPEAVFLPFRMGTTMGYLPFGSFPFLDLLQAGLICGGLLVVLARLRDPQYLIVALWFLVPMALLSVGKLDLYQHYFIAFYPVQFILAGLCADTLILWLSARNRTLGHAFAGLVAAIVLYQFYVSVGFLNFITTQKNIAWMEYGPPLKVRVAEIRELFEQGIVSPEEIQRKLLQGKSKSAALKYDFSATKYLSQNLKPKP